MKNINKKYYGLFVKLITNPAIQVMSKNLGIDLLFYDNEHSSFSKSELHNVFLFANNIGLPSFIRVGELSRREIGQMLDNGAAGIMVPMIETKEQAELLVKYSKYPPLGLRGYSSGAHTNYGPSGNHKENMQLKNETIVTIAQIETKEGVKNAREILEVEGIDACILGPVDLSISLGVVGNIMADIELEACRKVIDICKELDKPVGIIGSNEILEYFKEDLNYFISANDSSILRNGIKDAVEQYKKITS